MAEPHAEQCTKCKKNIEGDLYLVRCEIVCQRCHDLLQPQCPYCRTYTKRKKIPERRSSFRCRNCGGQIHVEPSQWLYDAPYLTDEQQGFLGFLEQLDTWIFTLGSRDDYRKVQAALREKFGGEPGISDVLWELMHESLRVLGDQHNAGIKEMRQLFDGKLPSELAETGGAKYEMRELQDLMKEFRAFEHEVKAARKQRAKS